MRAQSWREDFREWCLKERDERIRSAEMFEAGTIRLSENNVDISEEWASRNRRIAQEMDELIAKIDEDIQLGS